MKSFYSFFISFPLLICNSYSMDAKEIIKKAEDLVRGKTLYSEMELKIIRPEWQRSISLKSWSKGFDYSLTYITAPARDRGQVFLKRKKELWNWVPSISRLIKMPPSMLSQSWMGSDFTNDDLVKESSILKDYKHILVGSEKISDKDCFKLKLIPLEEVAVVWGQILLWIEKETFIQLKGEQYDEDLELVNTQIATSIKKMDGRLIATKMEIIPADKPNHKTEIVFNKVKYNKPVKDRFFSQQNMKRIR